MFKIDLIVWKYCIIYYTFVFILKFKIDLIVWKLNKRMEIANENELFKIDLIVWKFDFNDSSLLDLVSLK